MSGRPLARCGGALRVKSLAGCAVYTERNGSKVYEHCCDSCGRTSERPVVGGECARWVKSTRKAVGS